MGRAVHFVPNGWAYVQVAAVTLWLAALGFVLLRHPPPPHVVPYAWGFGAMCVFCWIINVSDFLRHFYIDHGGLTIRSPFTGTVHLPWNEVTEVEVLALEWSAFTNAAKYCKIWLRRSLDVGTRLRLLGIYPHVRVHIFNVKDGVDLLRLIRLYTPHAFRD